MRTLAIILSVICFSNLVFGQVSGDIKRDQRKITKQIKYTVPYAKAGIIVFDIVVNRDGIITTCNIDRSTSTVTDNPIMKRAQGQIMQGLRFLKGNDYPQFHKGIVEIKTTQ